MVLKRSLQTDLIFTRLLPSNYSRIFVGCSSQSTCTFLSKVLSCMFSLFNLQGTRPRISSFGFSWAPHSADLHFITRFSLCQELFCSFFNRFLSKPPRDQRSVILADHSFLVKHFFQILFISLSFLLILTLSLLFSCRLCLNLVRYDCYILYNIFFFENNQLLFTILG